MNSYNLIVCCHSITPSKMVDNISVLEKKFNFKAKGVIVDNSDIVDNNAELKNSNFKLIKGSNKYLDFSAYFEGNKNISISQKKSNNIIFLNDSFFIKHNVINNFKLVLKHINLLDEISEPVIIGRGSNYHSICHRNPWSKLDIFIPTYCFALNNSALHVLNSLEEMLFEDGFKGAISAKDFYKNLDSSFYNLMKSSVNSFNSPYSWKKENFHASDEILQKKALCIYFEHRLSGEIGKKGCIIPTNAGIKGELFFNLNDFLKKIYLTRKWKK